MNQTAAQGIDPIVLPRFKCHKDVRAAKITGFLVEPEMGFSRLALEGGAEVRPDMMWMHKHDPKVGGYYVVYEDGYASYSPAKAFEEGYTRIEG